jgi:hypothetical protein
MNFSRPEECLIYDRLKSWIARTHENDTGSGANCAANNEGLNCCLNEEHPMFTELVRHLAGTELPHA